MPETPVQPPSSADNDGTITPDDPQTAAFIRTLMINGQAAELAPDGKLPPGATHEIVGMSDSGLPIVRRRRFAAF